MKKGLTEIIVVIDKSGSMRDTQQQVIEGFNEFLREQSAQPGEATLTMTQFNTDYCIVHDGVALADVPALDTKSYCPEGGTALIDAACRTIDKVTARHANMPDAEKPERVLMVITTDGQENSSIENKKDDLKKRVTDLEAANWRFIFFGANIDAFAEAGGYGVQRGATASYKATAQGTRSMYDTISQAALDYRSKGSFTIPKPGEKPQQEAPEKKGCK